MSVAGRGGARRVSTRYVDGTNVFKTEEDRSNEDYVARTLSRVWSRPGSAVVVHHFGDLNPVDFWIEKSGRVIGYAELKSRKVASDRYPTVFLAVSKWLALSILQLTGVPAMFLVRYTDGIFYINISDVVASNVTVAGAVYSDGGEDKEPCIEVPISSMKCAFRETV